jgi:glycosyltransferase involved in cell wall biosynthesis
VISEHQEPVDVVTAGRSSSFRVCQVSKADAAGGGASRVAEELNGLLNASGNYSEHWVSWSSKPYTPLRRPLYGQHEGLFRRAHRVGKLLGIPELIPLELLPMLRRKCLERFDVFHFHDLSSAISPLTLWYLSLYRPVVWTFHDCSPFTGGCLYPMECGNYRHSCGSCPQLGEWPLDTRLDLTRLLRLAKKCLHSNGRVMPVTPSHWMADRSMESGLLEQRPRVINNGVDL